MLKFGCYRDGEVHHSSKRVLTADEKSASAPPFVSSVSGTSRKNLSIHMLCPDNYIMSMPLMLGSVMWRPDFAHSKRDQIKENVTQNLLSSDVEYTKHGYRPSKFAATLSCSSHSGRALARKLLLMRAKLVQWRKTNISEGWANKNALSCSFPLHQTAYSKTHLSWAFILDHLLRV